MKIKKINKKILFMNLIQNYVNINFDIISQKYACDFNILKEIIFNMLNVQFL